MIAENISCAGCSMEYPETQAACHNCGYPNQDQVSVEAVKDETAIPTKETSALIPDGALNIIDVATSAGMVIENPIEESILVILQTVLGVGSLPSPEVY